MTSPNPSRDGRRRGKGPRIPQPPTSWRPSLPNVRRFRENLSHTMICYSLTSNGSVLRAGETSPRRRACGTWHFTRSRLGGWLGRSFLYSGRDGAVGGAGPWRGPEDRWDAGGFVEGWAGALLPPGAMVSGVDGLSFSPVEDVGCGLERSGSVFAPARSGGCSGRSFLYSGGGCGVRAGAERDEAIDDAVAGHIEKLSTIIGPAGGRGRRRAVPVFVRPFRAQGAEVGAEGGGGRCSGC